MLAGGGSAAGAPLQTILADHSRPPLVRAIAADALRVLNDLTAVDIAHDLLQFESDAELVIACLRLIRQLGHRDHADVVRPFTASPNPVVRAAAVGALGAIGQRGEAALLQGMLDDDAYWVTLEAARGLKALGAAETLRQLADEPGPHSVLAQQVLSE
jgi:HEAT repeat protein